MAPIVISFPNGLRYCWFQMTPRAPETQADPDPGRLGAAPFAEVPATPGGVGAPAFAIPDHQLLGIIGQGSYGQVWLARNVLGELRAVKIIYRSRFAQSRPFEREFEGIQRFEPISRSHPSQLSILHVGKNEQAGCFYYVMEVADNAGGRSDERVGAAQHSDTPGLHDPTPYVAHTLRHDLEQRGRVPIAECVQIGRSLTTALAHLHAHGLVHRDIKPSNVIFVNGVPKLGDIGLVTAAGDTQSIVGTEGYLPSEGPGTVQADIFSLGKVLYEISTGMDRRRFAELPEDLREWPDRHDVVEFNEIVLKACARDPAQRYPTAEQMGVELALLEGGHSLRRKRIAEQRRALLGRGLLVALLLGLLATGATLLSRALRSQEYHSRVPGVDALVEQGNEILKRTTPEGLEAALDTFNQAARKDPTFAPALIGVFQARFSRVFIPFANPPADEVLNLRVAATNLARLKPALGEARIAAATLDFLDGNLPAWLTDLSQAVNLPTASPGGFALVHICYGWRLMYTFDPEGGLRELLLAERKRGSDPLLQTHLGHAYALLHDFPKALEHYDISLRLEPAQTMVYELRANVLREQGNILQSIDDAEAWWRNAGGSQARRATNSFNELRGAFLQGGQEGYWRKCLEDQLKVAPLEDPLELAVCLKHLGKLQQAYDCLYRIQDPAKLRERLWSDICFDRSDPRFKELVRRCDSVLIPSSQNRSAAH
jgi:tetratricopeptide (TPR) repeat protein